MADSSNTEVDSQVDESTESETTSNSNGNFSGGLDSSALSDESFSTDSTPDFGIDFGSNNNNGSFDFSYNPFDDSGFDFGDEDTTIYEVKCACGNVITFDEDTLEAGSIVCDECGETLEFTFEDEDEE